MFKRKGRHRDDDLLVVLNLSDQHFSDWNVSIKGKNSWQEIFNSNSIDYWGTGEYQNTALSVNLVDKKKKICEIIMNIPALSAVIFR